jgi:hypothetical protein
MHTLSAHHLTADQYQSDIRRGIVYHREQMVNTLAYIQFQKGISQKNDSALSQNAATAEPQRWLLQLP